MTKKTFSLEDNVFLAKFNYGNWTNVKCSGYKCISYGLQIYWSGGTNWGFVFMLNNFIWNKSRCKLVFLMNIPIFYIV